MNTSDIVLAIDAEIAQLQKVKVLLTGTDLTTKRKPGRPAAPNKVTSFNPVEFAHAKTCQPIVSNLNHEGEGTLSAQK